MIKTIQTKEESFIQFTDEETAELGINKGDKFTVEIDADGSIKLIPFSTIEIDLAEFPREVLEDIIIQSIKNGQRVEEYISDVLELFLAEYD